MRPCLTYTRLTGGSQDADVPTSKLRELYTVLVQDVRTMFQVCRLVHADLSEYNILYFAGRLAIIDVSQVRLSSGLARCAYVLKFLAKWCAQSVDLDHPRCFDFLKEDLTHVNDFFSRRGALRALAVQQLRAHGLTMPHRCCDRNGARAL